MADSSSRQCGFCFGAIDSDLEHVCSKCDVVVHVTCASLHATSHICVDTEFSDLECEESCAMNNSVFNHSKNNSVNAMIQNSHNNSNKKFASAPGSCTNLNYKTQEIRCKQNPHEKTSANNKPSSTFVKPNNKFNER